MALSIFPNWKYGRRQKSTLFRSLPYFQSVCFWLGNIGQEWNGSFHISHLEIRKGLNTIQILFIFSINFPLIGKYGKDKIALNPAKCISAWMHIWCYTLCTMWFVHCTMYDVQCAMYNVQCAMCNVQCTMYNVQCTMYNGLYNVHWTVQCTLDTIQCAVYDVH